MTNRFLDTFFKLLNKENIQYAVLRNYESLPNSLDGSDLDILIAKESVEKFYTLLNKSLELNNGKVIVKYGKLIPRICVAGVVENNYYGVQFDVHENILPYQSNSMFPVDFFLSRVNKYNGINVSNDDDASMIAFFKEIFYNKNCKEKYFLDAQQVWVKNKKLYTEVLLPIYGDKFIDKLNKLFNNSYNNHTIKLLSESGRSILTNSISTKLNNLNLKVSRLYRFLNPPGFTIAFLGTDGSGKTTIIDKITPPLNEAVHNAFFYEHMRPNIIPNIAQLFGKKKIDKPVSNPHASKPSGIVGSSLRLFYYSFDYIFGYLFKIYPMMVKKSSIWIFDRYYYDYIIDPKRARINLPIWVVNFISFFIPKPDLILCFGAEPQVIFDRKPELELEEVVNQVNKLKKFCSDNENSIWIDTGKLLDESVNDAFSIILEQMSKRYDV